VLPRKGIHGFAKTHSFLNTMDWFVNETSLSQVHRSIR
jgi:hypothetical protein